MNVPTNYETVNICKLASCIRNLTNLPNTNIRYKIVDNFFNKMLAEKNNPVK